MSDVGMLVQMGFPEDMAKKALSDVHGDFAMAIDLLLNQSPQGRVGAGQNSPTEANKPKPFEMPPPPLDHSDTESVDHLSNKHNAQVQPHNVNNNAVPYSPGYPGVLTQQETKSAGIPNVGLIAPASPSSVDPTMTTLPTWENIKPAMESVGITAPASLPDPSDFESSPSTIKLQICYMKNADKPTLEETKKLIDLCQKEHIQCALNDITDDEEMKPFIRSFNGGKLILPMVLLGDQCLGGYTRVEPNAKSIRSALAKQVTSQDDYTYPLDEYRNTQGSTGPVDGVMNMIGAVAGFFWRSSSASTMMGASTATSSTMATTMATTTSSTNATNATNATNTTNATSTSPVPARSASPSSQNAGYIDFTVLRTNWYGRQQRRIIRFGKESFYRIDPTTGEVRESKKYTTIKEFSATNSQLNIVYEDDTVDLWTVPSSALDYICYILIANGNQEMKIVFKEPANYHCEL